MVNPPLNITWDREYKTVQDYEDEHVDVVVVPIDPVAEQQARRNHPTSLPAKSIEDDGVRLHTPDTHRATAVKEIQTRLTQAGLELIAARGWSAAIGYHTEVRDVISEAISTVIHAQDLLHIHEDK